MVSSSVDDLVHQLFFEILTEIVEFIKNSKNDDTLKTNNMDFQFRWTVSGFTYDDSGVHVEGIVPAKETGEEWSVLHGSVLQYFLKLPRVLKLEKLISDNYQLPKNYVFDGSLILFIDSAFKREWTSAEIKETVSNALKHLKGEKFLCNATVELIGIILQEPSVDLGSGIKIRQTSKNDINENFPIYPAQYDLSDQYPTAIMEVEMYAEHAIELKKRITHIISILRLFRVGSIRHRRFKIHSVMLDPWFGGGGISMETLDKSCAAHTYLVRQSDKECLEKFFGSIEDNAKKMSNTLSKKYKFATIAYDRYVDCLKNSSADRKIADAVMGLESIFLQKNNGELSFRLSLRVACLMKILNEDQLKVRDTIKDAYTIRSKFVHGDCIGSKDEEKLAKYGGRDAFIKKLLEILRIALVVSITMDMSKSDFIQILDKSLLEYCQEEVNRVVSNAQNILCTNKE